MHRVETPLRPGDRVRAGLIAALLAVTGLTSIAAVAENSVRIMPLGDSITQGNASQRGYRPLLWRRLDEAGFNVDFVGSLNRSIGQAGPPTDFDGDHEGHWGWRADQILARINGWAADARPDVVLLHIGTNDIGTGEDPARTAGEVRGILVRLRNANPDVDVLLAALIPLVYEEVNERVREFNRLLASLAQELDRPGSQVVLVDHYTGFEPRHDTYDGVHPDESGATKMAEIWYEALSVLIGPPD